jgi:D-sedoheptulose 7-phosphate isomerase
MNKRKLENSIETNHSMVGTFSLYSQRLQQLLSTMDWSAVEQLCLELVDCRRYNRQIFLCGNGGSAGNAIHLANDLIYGAGGLRAEALPANSAVLTCLANDVSYDSIYSLQLQVKANKDDLLIVLSGSGNSGNIVKAVEKATSLGMRTAGILGYSGGQCKNLVDIPVHAPIDDMQISEDMQLVVGHMIMQWLCANPVKQKSDVND